MGMNLSKHNKTNKLYVSDKSKTATTTTTRDWNVQDPMEIHARALDRHKKVAVLNRVMRPRGQTDINRQ